MVPEHELQGLRHGLPAPDHDVLADQAVFDPSRDVQDAAAFENDRVLDFAVADFDGVIDRGEWPNIGIDDARAPANDGRPTNHTVLDHRAGLDDHLSDQLRTTGNGSLVRRLETVEHDPVGLQHVLQAARVLPPSVDDVRLHLG